MAGKAGEPIESPKTALIFIAVWFVMLRLVLLHLGVLT